MKIGSLGGIEVIISAMKSHGGLTNIGSQQLVTGSHALFNLAEKSG